MWGWERRTSRAAILAGLLTSCSPSITKFDATPRLICPGDEVELVWEFVGSGTLTASPRSDGVPSGTVDDADRAKFRPHVPTTIVLRVTRNIRAPKKAQVDVEIESGTEVAASAADASASCVNNVLTSTARMTGFGTQVVTMVGVGDGNKRVSLGISRNDPNSPSGTRTATITAAQLSPALAGLPVNGDWAISSPLLPGETCDGPKPVLPKSLIVRAYTKCHGGP